MIESSLAEYLDSTLLRPDATRKEIIDLCIDARRYEFRAVCVNPIWVELAREHLAESSVSVCTVVAFPLGAQLTKIKVNECEEALRTGASEIDVVINIGAVRGQEWTIVETDLAAVVEVCRRYGACCKAILEMCLLSEEEKRKAAEIAVSAGADYIKTSTGYSDRGATVADVRRLREWIGKRARIKAAGGIKTGAVAREMLAVGASRIGTSRAITLITDE